MPRLSSYVMRRRGSSPRKGQILVLAGVFLAGQVLFAQTPASAAAGCTFSGSTVFVFIDAPGEFTYIGRSFDGNIQVNRTDCVGANGEEATIHNVDLIEVVDHTATSGTTVVIELRYGGLSPGLTTEPIGFSEIEVDVDFGSNFDSDGLRLWGTDPDTIGNGEDVLTFGADGAAFNEDADADVTFTTFKGGYLNGRGGDDRLSGAGGYGTGGPFGGGTEVWGGVQFHAQGLEGNDLILGGDYFDILEGWDGDDRIYGGEYDDLLSGGEGADHLDGQEGTSDDISYINYETTGVYVNLSTGEARGGAAEGDTFTSIEGVTGTRFADELIGSAASNTLYGREGDDILMGLDGDDFLHGNSGDDFIDGGAGDDRFSEDSAPNGADTMIGGSGIFDEVDYSFRSNAVSVTPDGIADDGEPGENDNVGEDVEEVRYPRSATTPSPTPTSSPTPQQSPSPASSGYPSPTPAPSTSGSPSPTPTPSPSTSPSPSPVSCGAYGGNHIVGTADDDRLVGTEGPDVICGLGGNDTIRGLGGNDLILGGGGNDEIDAGSGADTVRGGQSDLRSQFDEIEGGLGADRLYGQGGKDVIRAGGGDDLLAGGPGQDTLSGQAGSDIIRSGSGSGNYLSGGGDRDRLIGGPGSEPFDGGSGNDVMKGRGGHDYMKAGGGNDRVVGGRGKDQIIGMGGYDTCYGGGGADQLVSCERGGP